jgi:hypothetical protein
MDGPRGIQLDGTAVTLAQRAEEATRGMCCQTYGRHGIGSSAEVHQVLGSLTEIVESLASSLPALTAWLERQLWSGTLLDAPDNATFDDLIESMHATATALARARLVGAQLGEELNTARNASQGLVRP